MTKNDVADRIRTVMVETALRAYEDAGVQGLCAEGRWEAAVSALRSVDLASLLREVSPSPDDARAEKSPRRRTAR